jgi:phenylpyruvate tautomerase
MLTFEGGGKELPMPYLKIQTTAAVSGQRSVVSSATDPTQAFLKKASRLVAQELGKPEQYMMVSLEPASAIMFAGSTEPAAFLELKAIGFPVAKANELSRLLCELIESELGIRKDRIYINFADIPPNMWGWNGETF